MNKRKRDDTTNQEPRDVHPKTYTEQFVSVVEDAMSGIRDVAKLVCQYEGLLAPVVALTPFVDAITDCLNSDDPDRWLAISKEINWPGMFKRTRGLAERLAFLVDQRSKKTINVITKIPAHYFRNTRIVPILIPLIELSNNVERLLYRFWDLEQGIHNLEYRMYYDKILSVLFERYQPTQRKDTPAMISWTLKIFVQFHNFKRDVEFSKRVIDMFLHGNYRNGDSPGKFMYMLLQNDTDTSLVKYLVEQKDGLDRILDQFFEDENEPALRALVMIAKTFPEHVAKHTDLHQALITIFMRIDDDHEENEKMLAQQLYDSLIPFWKVSFCG